MKKYKIDNFQTYFPTKFSKTEDFPADCPPTTAIWGRSMTMGTPRVVKASCMRLMMGIRASIPRFPDAILEFCFWMVFGWQKVFHLLKADGLFPHVFRSGTFSFLYHVQPPTATLFCMHTVPLENGGNVLGGSHAVSWGIVRRER